MRLVGRAIQWGWQKRFVCSMAHQSLSLRLLQSFPNVLKGPQRDDAAHPLGMPFQFILAHDKLIVFLVFFFYHEA